MSMSVAVIVYHDSTVCMSNSDLVLFELVRTIFPNNNINLNFPKIRSKWIILGV